MAADKNYRDQFEERKVRVIDSFDLDDNVLTPEFPHWRHGDFACAKEAGNDSHVRIIVEAGIQSEYERGETQKFIDTGEDNLGYGMPDCLLSILCERGLIEPGTYLVGVCW